MKKCFALFAGLSALVLTGSALPVFHAEANSAQSHWSGRDSFGAYVKEEKCPVTVAGEKLTLRIPEFPKNHYTDFGEFANYSASVVAEYTFRNPASYDVEMTLVFPFGAKPDYVYELFGEDGDRVEADDTAKYLITADGKEIPRTLRHTLFGLDFDPSADLARLSEDHRTNGIFSFETPVTVYHYRQVVTENTSKSSFIAASFKGLGDSGKTRVMLDHASGYNAEDDSIGLWGKNYGTNEALFSLYVFGEPLSRMPEWKVYEDGACKKLTEGSVVSDEKLPTETTTFGQLAMERYKQESGVSETDWFNAVLDSFGSWNDGDLTLKNDINSFDVSRNLMRWYEYHLEIPAGGEVVNSVSAPLYPSIDLGYEPPVYTYTYFLSPASAWAEFGDFTLAVETPYYVTESALRFVKGEGGYTYSQKGLPEGELTFTMSTAENPVRDRSYLANNIKFFFTYFWWLPVILAVIILTVIIIIVLRKRKPKKPS